MEKPKRGDLVAVINVDGIRKPIGTLFTEKLMRRIYHVGNIPVNAEKDLFFLAENCDPDSPVEKEFSEHLPEIIRNFAVAIRASQQQIESLQKQINAVESMADSNQQGLMTTQKEVRKHIERPHVG